MPSQSMNDQSPGSTLGRRVVLTGGPAAGKTAVAEVLRRHLADEVTVLPESASILFRGGFPRGAGADQRRHVQRAIYRVQTELEAIYSLSSPELTQICDRGTLDGAAYWPGGTQPFLGAMGTTTEDEYRRYDAVIFLETSAYGQEYETTRDSIRTETSGEARKLDERLREIWSGHRAFYVVEHSKRFYEKVAAVLITLHKALGLGNSQ